MQLFALLVGVLSAATAVSADDAKTTTIGYFGADVFTVEIPRYDSTAASVAGINALATTYHIKCLDGAPKSDCQIATPWTMIQGESTFSLTGVYTYGTTATAAVTATRDINCAFSSYSVSASCSFSFAATGSWDATAYSTSTSSSTKNIPTESVTFYELEVTGGVDSFTAPAATKTPDAAAALPAAQPLITAAPIGAAAALAVAAMF
ncbi:predicted protein [Aspergillus terreus NIH2624]|jgi:hypothetical protein|uniref:Ig-like domain-containing protein n=1 Tax=Aspergillus terreus (strain NIH 2624 / FGSC A1156) TaxID=341663 RepID=Q0CMA3_ASPTN|nr:uncharacterized protein ATEG_05181 [Aspergillus terreus NIH2624]EAU34250.1 predicted protein [Aspergillus terreus NIH2624]